MLDEANNRYLGLSAPQRVEFLALLHYYLSLVARGSYVEAGNDETSATRGLRAHNEMIQVASKQLLVALGRWKQDSAYPDEMFLDILLGKAKQGSCEGDLAWAVGESLNDIGIK
jgi:hypothetical protein